MIELYLFNCPWSDLVIKIFRIQFPALSLGASKHWVGFFSGIWDSCCIIVPQAVYHKFFTYKLHKLTPKVTALNVSGSYQSCLVDWPILVATSDVHSTDWLPPYRSGWFIILRHLTNSALYPCLHACMHNTRNRCSKHEKNDTVFICASSKFPQMLHFSMNIIPLECSVGVCGSTDFQGFESFRSSTVLRGSWHSMVVQKEEFFLDLVRYNQTYYM